MWMHYITSRCKVKYLILSPSIPFSKNMFIMQFELKYMLWVHNRRWLFNNVIKSHANICNAWCLFILGGYGNKKLHSPYILFAECLQFIFLLKQRNLAGICLAPSPASMHIPQAATYTPSHPHTHTRIHRHTQTHMLTLRLPGCLGGVLFSGRQCHMLSSLPGRAEPTAVLLSWL